MIIFALVMTELEKYFKTKRILLVVFFVFAFLAVLFGVIYGLIAEGVI